MKVTELLKKQNDQYNMFANAVNILIAGHLANETADIDLVPAMLRKLADHYENYDEA